MEKLKKEIANKNFKSYRNLSKITGISDKTVKKYLKILGIEKRTRKEIPNISEFEKKTQKKRLKNLVNDFIKVKSDHKFIIDDKTYFTLDETKSQPKHYYSVNEKNIIKTSSKLPKYKYPLKIILWLEISEKGISKPVFLKDNKRLTGMFYSKFCIPKLKEFIEKHHKRDKIVFWPDLASSHYSKVSLNTLHKLKIEYLPKFYNPPKCPQIRPIEHF